jgi:RND family efflux transporter MFP subunit
MNELNQKISSLEQEIATMDPSFAQQNRKSTLVTTVPVQTKTFRHFVEVRGSVASRKNVTLSAEVPGRIQAVQVTEGQIVSKGQVLLTLDAETTQNNIKELETSLELATTRFERQANLWEKKIGTEIQYLEAKNQKESLERRLATARSQLAQTVIRAPFGGTIDRVMARVGEMAQPGVPLVRIVSLTDMYVEADLSESLLGKFHEGDSVEVRFPSLNKTVQSTINAIGQVIDPNNRTFTVEIRLPANNELFRPNLLTVIKISDFEAKEAVVVPTNLIQTDNSGDFIYIAKQKEEVMEAEKIHVKRGLTYENETMITSGLQGDEKLIREGFREVAEGVAVREAEQNI